METGSSFSISITTSNLITNIDVTIQENTAQLSLHSLHNSNKQTFIIMLSEVFERRTDYCLDDLNHNFKKGREHALAEIGKNHCPLSSASIQSEFSSVYISSWLKTDLRLHPVYYSCPSVFVTGV
jgi:hypothetical protein